ncbi:SNF2 family N-terminal domain-containing protein [Gigaspora rosea]|uniref:SNF2 family N-terminal domain-containing protein n=1 Tax=Gigaspora rosea TaxID=44941 RepID=A0A397UP82_9GLOM|nr:SNF2 family N-terminal domain-containing protein [Gigaspora rosea]
MSISIKSSTKSLEDKKTKFQRQRQERKAQKQALEQDTRKLNQNKIRDTAKRYQFLLGHSELFSHFIDLKKTEDEEFKVLVEEAENFSNSIEESSGSRRHRKTEKEEDEELLKDEADESLGVMQVFTESPSFIKNGTMRDYQLQGLNWMISLFENGINGILADEMGLGKTLQSISFLGYLKYVRNIPGPHLVVAPKSTLHNWQKEFNMWIPDFHVVVLHGNKKERAEIIAERLLPKDFQVCITSYEMCLIEKAALKKFAFQYIIIDEAHRIKNENSMLSQIVRVFKSRNRLLITGTPLQNNLHELWALLNFLLPDVFSSSKDFDSWFKSHDNQDNVVQQLHKVLRPFLLRRIKSDVEKSLLPKKEVNIYVGMTSMQRKWYQRILEKDIAAVNGAVSKSESKTRLLNIVMQLRKCCNHPYLFDGAEPGPPYTTDEHLINNAGKMMVLDKLLKRLKSQGSRVLLFSQMSRVLDILEDYCIFRDFEYCRIDGQTKQEDRITAIDDYNAPGSSKFIFLLTTRAGGLGINLTSADIVILYDSDWNPQVDLQAQDRAHRIGQTKQVYVFRFVTENAIEEKVLERAAQKLRLDQLVIQQGRLTQSQKAASKDELLTMIQHGAESVFNSNDSTVTDDDIESILRKGEEKTVELNMKYQSLGLDDLQNFTSESAYQWQGEDWSNKRKGQTSRFNWIEPPKRERKANYAVDSYYREALRLTPKPTQPKVPRAPKQIIINEFQFYPPRLVELLKKEMYHQQKLAGYKVALAEPQGENEDDIEARERERQEEQAKIDSAEALTEEEEAEKEALMEDIFEDWSKRDYNNFVNASAKYGRNALEEIASEIEGKTLAEVKAYAKVFWQRYQELPNHEEIIAKIVKGESKLQQTVGIQELLRAKVAQYRTPGHQLQVSNQAKGKTLFSEEEDRYLLIALAKYGYGTEDVYEKIRNEIESAEVFRFNWFIKSRTSGEIARRCTTLINLLQKEHGEEESAQPVQDEKKRKVNSDSFIISNGSPPAKRGRH